MLPLCFIWVTGGASLGRLVLHGEDIVTGREKVECTVAAAVR